MELLRHPRVYAFADIFRIENLKTLSCHKFEQQLQQHWISDTLVDCIREVYLTSNDIKSATTRRAVVNIVSSNRRDLIDQK